MGFSKRSAFLKLHLHRPLYCLCILSILLVKSWMFTVFEAGGLGATGESLQAEETCH